LVRALNLMLFSRHGVSNASDINASIYRVAILDRMEDSCKGPHMVAGELRLRPEN
jgi:hypothetical protein